MTKAPPVILCDFETHGILPRPKYPPKPVSLALKYPDRKDWVLMSWGHEGGGNNCTEKEARAEYIKAVSSKYPMAFQYGMFDMDVAETHWEVPLPDYKGWHDTMFLLFLWDPYAPTLSLKPSAERLLGIKPEEQDHLREWILSNVPEAKRKPSEWGAYIWKAPYQIVRPYHKGDLVRTGKLFNWLYPRIVEGGMLEAYERELKLMPLLLRNARRGMRIDVDRLAEDVKYMQLGVKKADDWLCKRLGIENIDSDQQLGNALYERGLIRTIHRTEKGQISVSKKYLTLDNFTEPKVYQALQYRNQMSTSLNMFALPWLELAAEDNGVIHPNWTQVRRGGANDRGTNGAKTGRIICTKPNFLNIPKKWKRSITAGYAHPAWLKVPELPFMRTYCLPSKGKLWGRRDWNQQEVRLFAHFEEGPVAEGFRTDPRYDIHETVRSEAERLLIAAALREEFDRDSAKTTVFGRFYGQGLSGLIESLKLREEEKPVAQIIQKAINKAVPSIKYLDDQLKEIGRAGDPIRTWGGRLYYVEEPSYSKKYGRNMTFEYKLISMLIQGSGADVAKEALVRYDQHPRRTEDFIVTVYDEIDIDLPKSKSGQQHEMGVLRECMEDLLMDVPMLSDGEVGPNWGKLEGVKF